MSRYERIIGHVVTQRRCPGGTYAYARTRDDITCTHPVPLQVETLAITQIHTVVPHVDVKRLAEFSRPVGQLRIRHAAPPFAHEVKARNRRNGPDQHATGHTGRLGHHVQAGVLAGSKDVRVSGRTEEHLGSPGSTSVRMSSGVAFGQVGFSLDNASRHGSVDEDPSEQIPGYVAGVPTEKSAVQPKGLRTPGVRIRPRARFDPPRSG